MTSLYRTVLSGLAGAVLAAMLTGAAAMAQEATPLSKEHMAAAKRTVLATKSSERFDLLLPQLAERTRGLFIQSNPAITKDITEAVDVAALQVISQRIDLDVTIRELWARRYSIEELNQITAFYESPIGQKLANQAVTINILSSAAARKWNDALSAEIVTLVRKELEKRGHSFDK